MQLYDSVRIELFSLSTRSRKCIAQVGDVSFVSRMFLSFTFYETHDRRFSIEVDRRPHAKTLIADIQRRLRGRFKGLRLTCVVPLR